MGKNVLFWVGIKSENPHLREKHGDFKYLDISRPCWESWCKKNDVIFFPYEKTTEPDTNKHKATWQRWFDVFKQIEDAGIDYNKIAVIDGSTLIRWDTPNFFDLTDERLVAFRSLENLRWITESVDGYNDFFNNFDFKLNKYISCGFQIFGKNHKKFLEELKDFYYTNYDSIMDLQNNKVGKGTDQPVYNYLLQQKNIEVNRNFPPNYMITHLYRFDWFGHNWQLQDKVPFFLKYTYIWFFSGFPNRGDRYDLMKKVWDGTKENYK
tara:strand:- start:24 stop:821 length:798 start_codon:yes stop_codon:yes gene_type:complete